MLQGHRRGPAKAPPRPRQGPAKAPTGVLAEEATQSEEAESQQSELLRHPSKLRSDECLHADAPSNIPPPTGRFLLPARALMRERSNRRAELFSLSQSSASQRLLTPPSLVYCCWISMWSNSPATDVISTSP
ncbi:hypothetical protein EYF80_035456 [Liparis tanakae]|uniref:Uncharacterized protein n=1 Tax=Liparis tanakae TaxID=230148 RepID=A0A4Z2GLD7_9TELE|nr:hypothetical protein EYF80_035456 [Liparis tanakae]